MAREPRELTGVKTLQIKILKRYLSKKELEKFLIEYRAHKRGWGGSDRFDGMARPLTKEQREVTQLYFFNKDMKSIKELSEESGKSYGQFINAVYKGALKILYQNRDKLKLEELLGGGE